MQQNFSLGLKPGHETCGTAMKQDGNVQTGKHISK